MSRKLTTYTQPSIAERLATAPDIDRLAVLWRQIGRRVASGQMEADAKTMERWVAACWLRVDELIRAAATDSVACYIYNVTLRWPKPPGVQEALYRTFSRVMQALPNEAERDAAAGITLGGRTP